MKSLRDVVAVPLLASLLASAAQAAPLAHMVYFTLAEPSETNRDALVAACHQRLAGHEGVLYFSVGVVAAGLDRPVNDRDFDVALHVVFANREAHDAYQTHPRHVAFVAEAKSLWSTVRVFDADLVEAPTTSASDSSPATSGDPSQ